MILRKFWVRHRDQLIEKAYKVMNQFDSLTPEVTSSPPLGNKIMVIAPHCDDETLGCGGTIYKHHQAGCTIEVIFVTESEDSYLASTRRKESENAAHILGIKRCHFLQQRELTLRPTVENVSRVKNIIKDFRPEVLYLPHPFENQSDHKHTYQIVVSALGDYAHEIKCLCYEVWSTLMPNTLIDISEAIEVKKRATQCYQSQLSSNNYLEKIIGLNRYRTIVTTPEILYAEGFYKGSLKTLKRFFRI